MQVPDTNAYLLMTRDGQHPASVRFDIEPEHRSHTRQHATADFTSKSADRRREWLQFSGVRTFIVVRRRAMMGRPEPTASDRGRPSKDVRRLGKIG